MGKHLCWSLFLIKLQAFRPANLLKRDFNQDAFLLNLQSFSEHLFGRTLRLAQGRKKITERKIQEKRGDKLAGGFGWRYKSLNGLKGAGVEP